MRTVDKILHVLMWLGLSIGLLILAAVLIQGVRARNFTDPGALRVMGALSVLWVPAALSLWQWDSAKPGAQSRWFYLFAVVALLVAAVIVAFFLGAYVMWMNG
jgi:hypothetical protein